MTLRGYDTWKQPREMSGTFEAVCKHEPARCHGCGLLVREPRKVSRVVHDVAGRFGFRYSCRVGGLWGNGILAVAAWSADTCPRCGSDEYGRDTCGEVWRCHGTWVEGAGVELADDECPSCGGEDRIEAEPDDYDGFDG